MLDYNVFNMLSISETIFRLLLGAVLGGIIGFEREVHGRAAGFRTQLIVCVAAVLIMIISENYHFYLSYRYSNPTIRIDPARISAGALIGIGFLGAGVIVKSGFAIRGLTTAASIWIVSAIGLAIGGGFYLESVVTAVITIVALVSLRRVEKNINILLYKTITISTKVAEDIEKMISPMFSEYGLNVHSIDYKSNQTTGEFIYTFHVSTKNKDVVKEIFSKLCSYDFIKQVSISSYDAKDVL